MKIIKFVYPPVLTNMYMIESNKHIILIDPFIVNIDLSGKSVDYILLTHEHFDHISGVNYWKEKTGAKVISSKVCADRVMDSKKNLSRYFSDFCDLQTFIKVSEPVRNVEYTCDVDIVFGDQQEYIWYDVSIEALACPGHSLGSSVYIFNNKYLFAGDSMFRDYPTEAGLPGGSRMLWKTYSQPLLKNLSKELHVYPGHFEDFDLKDYNQWVV